MKHHREGLVGCWHERETYYQIRRMREIRSDGEDEEENVRVMLLHELPRTPSIERNTYSRTTHVKRECYGIE